ncbi:DUF4179 domain-containing protein [Brevibacillus formosus]|uniref:DUF4179 domain-containing protein n=1 Tax=Brevibacillus formosus TaxID=54913 RepID=A0A837KF90_9BACL|nr:DUF4179 domain-containing protein [Brevibacillus formosus]KLH96457.1 hypothetical protein AA984_25495 [Brevibacillus formosus]MED1958391.1 DUF4179 domain-containing protein [Brevibacillus formosus]PSJ94514.1 DUF4179 domain-containing protein [Brevibacillus formosus]GED60068.1 hypothetical protein BFO01nite_42000 [Brevibacillus formosus]
MTCLDTFMMNAYLEDKLPLRMKQDVQRHLNTCSGCQIKFEQYLDGLDNSDDEAEDVWQTEATIQNVMEKLPAYPMNVLKPIQKQPVQINWKKRSVDIVKKTTIAVAGLAMVVTFGTAVSPTFANYMNGIYASINPSEITVTKGPYNAKQVVDLFDKKQTDIGVKKAAENGFVQPLDMKVTDQGLTMEISAVVADPLRIMVLGSVKDSSGKKIPSFWKDQFSIISGDTVHEFREVRLKDKNGKVITYLDDKSELLRWLPLPNGENFAYGGQLGVYFNEANPMPDELILEMRVKRLTDTKGTWNFDIPIDMRPAKAAMKTVALNKELKTPTGATVELKEARFVPTATQLEFSNSNPNEKVVAGFRYELVDEKGTVVGKWDDMIKSDERDHNLNIIGMSYGSSVDFTTKLQPSRSFVHTYMPLDPAKNLTMKLDAVYTGEKVSSQTKLSLAELEKNPKKVDVAGNQITFQSIEMEVNEGDTLIDIPVEAILAKDIVGLPKLLTVKDENGNEARVVRLMVNKKENQNGTIKLEGKLEVLFQKKDVKEISVFLDHVIKENKVDWEVQIKEEKK